MGRDEEEEKKKRLVSADTSLIRFLSRHFSFEELPQSRRRTRRRGTVDKEERDAWPVVVDHFFLAVSAC